MTEPLPLTPEEEAYWQAGHRATPRERRLFATIDAARAERDEARECCAHRGRKLDARQAEFAAFKESLNAHERSRLAVIVERDAALAELDKLRRILPPSARGEGVVGEGSWAVFAEKVVAERDEAQMRCRAATQRIVDAIGADGPTSLEDALTRLFGFLGEAARLRSLVDSYKAPDAEAVLRAMLSPKDPRG